MKHQLSEDVKVNQCKSRELIMRVTTTIFQDINTSYAPCTCHLQREDLMLKCRQTFECYSILPALSRHYLSTLSKDIIQKRPKEKIADKRCSYLKRKFDCLEPANLSISPTAKGKLRKARSAKPRTCDVSAFSTSSMSVACDKRSPSLPSIPTTKML